MAEVGNWHRGLQPGKNRLLVSQDPLEALLGSDAWNLLEVNSEVKKNRAGRELHRATSPACPPVNV